MERHNGCENDESEGEEDDVNGAAHSSHCTKSLSSVFFRLIFLLLVQHMRLAGWLAD
jgi:hypothetical protein